MINLLKKWGLKMLFYIAAVVLLFVIAGQLGAFKGTPPSKIGVDNHQFKPPAKTPNSVSSQAHLHADHSQLQYASIEPLPFKNNNAANSMQVLVSVLKNMPSMTIVDAKPDYIYAQSQTKILKFVDDVEFWVNPVQGVIDVRSASRLGRKDFGVNRARIEAIRAAYNAN